MKKKLILSSIIFIIIIIILLVVLPFIRIDTNNKIIYVNYNGSIDEFDTNHCYHENVSYNEKRDISITKRDVNKYFIFYVIQLEYEKGNLCETEYLLEEEYVNDFINNAKITYNSHNIDIKKLIEGKTAIVGNTRYMDHDYETFIEYELDNKYQIMYIFYKDDLLILQVGSPDEDTKFIAYK